MTRAGFLVRNEPDVGSNLDLAEPDALDFNLLGNQRYGIIGPDATACAVTVTGSSYTVTVAAGVYVVNGQVAANGLSNVQLPRPLQDARFDLIVGDVSGHVTALVGTASPNPVFPTYDDKVCVFASILILPGTTPPLQAQVTDKRIMLMQRFATAILNSGPLLSNQDPNSLATLFSIDPNGKMWWQGDTALERVAPATLKVTSAIQAAQMEVTNLTVDNNLTVAGDIVASNFNQGTTNPTGTGTPGDVYKNIATGTIWVFQNGTWAQLSTVPIPPGMTMMGLMTTPPPGWLLVDGSVRTQQEVGGLWNAFPQWRIGNTTNMQLPNAKDCFYGWGTPGVKSGNVTPNVTIGINNLPAHKHLVSPTTDAGGSHGHTATVSPAGNHSHMTVHGGYYGGAHVHGVNDAGHVHYASDEPGVGQIICTFWGGLNKLDGLFNDASHTYSVEPVNGVRKAVTGISITTEASNHDHATDNPGDHQHVVTVGSGGAAHSHPIQENTVGGGQPIDIRPPFMGMWLYVKT